MDTLQFPLYQVPAEANSGAAVFIPTLFPRKTWIAASPFRAHPCTSVMVRSPEGAPMIGLALAAREKPAQWDLVNLPFLPPAATANPANPLE
jgi:hypothetical protein